VYCRVSTEEQAKEGFSIRAQQDKLKDYIKIKGWELEGIYIDDGISGKNITDRPEVNRLISDVVKGNVENVLVFKIDRLTRSTKDLISLMDLFNEKKCAFNSLMESIDTHTPSGRMFIKVNPT
jgi:site-specific DNA recombinase